MSTDIRPAQTGDIPALTDIYNYYVRETSITFDIEPKTMAERTEWFDRYLISTPHQLWVLHPDEQNWRAGDHAAQWDEKYPQISKSWRRHWPNPNTLFRYPADIRKAIYTTNAIESLNSVIRKAVKKRKLLPTEDAAKKVVYLAIMEASKKWTTPIRNWRLALNR